MIDLTLVGFNSLISNKYFPNEDNRSFVMEITHGPAYRNDCASCQSGVRYVKQAFDYLNEAFVIFNRDISFRDNDRVAVCIPRGQLGNYDREFDLHTTKVVVVDVEPEIKNLLPWFVRQFDGQLHMAHVNTLTLSSEKDTDTVLLNY